MPTPETERTHLHADHYNYFLLRGSGPNIEFGDVLAGPVGVYGPGPAGGLGPKFGGGEAPTIAPENPTPGIARVEVSAVLVPHGPIFPSFAFRFDTAHGSVTFSGDTTYGHNLVRPAEGSDVLVHEAATTGKVIVG
ncbi:MAG: hypothetical protein AAGC80_14385, partial [Rhodococcus sp. (in: high G+C Gram-positive bacteria)]